MSRLLHEPFSPNYYHFFFRFVRVNIRETPDGNFRLLRSAQALSLDLDTSQDRRHTRMIRGRQCGLVGTVTGQVRQCMCDRDKSCLQNSSTPISCCHLSHSTLSGPGRLTDTLEPVHEVGETPSQRNSHLTTGVKDGSLPTTLLIFEPCRNPCSPKPRTVHHPID